MKTHPNSFADTVLTNLGSGYAIIRKEPGKAPIAYVHARDDPN